MPRKIYTKDELMDELSRVTSLLGRPPSYEEMKKFGTITPKPFQTRFGTWENVKRLTGWTPLWERFSAKLVEPHDGYWLSGIVDGEGCLTMRHPVKRHTAWDPLFTISLRDDDSFMLDEIVRILGIENVHIHTDKNIAKRKKGLTAHPAKKLTIFDVPTLHFHLIAVLNRYPLRSKKKHELKIFTIAVDVLIRRRLEGRRNCLYKTIEIQMLRQCYYSLKELKQYNADYKSILARFDLTPD